MSISKSFIIIFRGNTNQTEEIIIVARYGKLRKYESTNVSEASLSRLSCIANYVHSLDGGRYSECVDKTGNNYYLMYTYMKA